MAQVFIVTGKLGSGKSLVCVGKIRDYLNQGRMVATNLDLYLENLVNPFAKNTRVYRVPDKPVSADLMALPTPYEGEYDENKTGLLVLDECGTWFNSRNYKDADRKGLNDLLLHIRKMGWDVMLIIQHFKMLDSQAREALGEQVVTCRRSDRLPIPGLSFVARVIGFELKLPKMHLAAVTYGTGMGAIRVGSWLYRGVELYRAYDTRQIFSDGRSPERDGVWGLASMLPPNSVYGRYTSESTHAKRSAQRAVNRMATSVKGRAAFLAGLLCAFIAWPFLGSAEEPAQQAQVLTVGDVSTDIEREAPKHPLDGVWITGSVRTSDGYEYVFYRDLDAETVKVFNPRHEGYMVRGNDPFKATLIKGGRAYRISDIPFHNAAADLP
ncbi:zonular occludens toxin domain-containing protein [Ferrimonas futtsuensis]|uniref:zonular occludens toxin domain-containing protein n=1 Tax=Ferrimonas futtsuensis TaxID=364764 RepID=UPI0004043C43|nr:zonular occludens toxin domain-containing protein [Ferrimonas futtsuensis]